MTDKEVILTTLATYLKENNLDIIIPTPLEVFIPMNLDPENRKVILDNLVDFKQKCFKTRGYSPRDEELTQFVNQYFIPFRVARKKKSLIPSFIEHCVPSQDLISSSDLYALYQSWSSRRGSTEYLSLPTLLKHLRESPKAECEYITGERSKGWFLQVNEGMPTVPNPLPPPIIPIQTPMTPIQTPVILPPPPIQLQEFTPAQPCEVFEIKPFIPNQTQQL